MSKSGWLILALIVFVLILFYFLSRKKGKLFLGLFESLAQFFNHLSAIDVLVLGGLVGLVIECFSPIPFLLPFKNPSSPHFTLIWGFWFCGVYVEKRRYCYYFYWYSLD